MNWKLRTFATPTEMYLSAFAVIAFGHALFVLFTGLYQEYLLGYAFRQTQTALTIRELINGSNWLRYQTPIFGGTWEVPFEFPLYQWIVAGLHLAVGMPIEPLGRAVSFAFFVATLWPIYLVLRVWQGSKELFLICSILFLTSPLMLFWSRTVLIETTALFFSAMWLAYLILFLQNRRRVYFAVSLVSGCLAALTKITTLTAFLLAGGIVVALHMFSSPALTLLWTKPTKAQFIAFARLYLPFLLLAATPVLAYLPWLLFSEDIKSAYFLTESLTSENLKRFIYGLFGLRFSGAFWTVIFTRAIPDILGSAYLVGGILLVYCAVKRKTLMFTLVALILFLFPMMVFSNLHAIHSYYQVANAIFLIAAMAFLLHQVRQHHSTMTFSIILLITTALTVSGFYQRYAPKMSNVVGINTLKAAVLEVSSYLVANTSPDSGIMIAGMDYSSEIPYYSDRKAVMIRFQTKNKVMRKILEDPSSLFSDVPIGAYVICDDYPRNGWRRGLQDMIDQFEEELARTYRKDVVGNRCRVYLTHNTLPPA